MHLKTSRFKVKPIPLTRHPASDTTSLTLSASCLLLMYSAIIKYEYVHRTLYYIPHDLEISHLIIYLPYTLDVQLKSTL